MTVALALLLLGVALDFFVGRKICQAVCALVRARRR